MADHIPRLSFQLKANCLDLLQQGTKNCVVSYVEKVKNGFLY